MNHFRSSLIFLLCYAYCILAKSHETHLLPEVKIVGYEGPLTSEMLNLFRGAELLEVVDSTFTSVPDRVLAKLPKLKKLHFENVTSTQIHPEVARDGFAVEEFYYIRCSWDDPRLEYFNGYVNLKKLVLMHQKYPLIELRSNSLNETKMIHLEIPNNGIEKIDDQAFNNLDKLKTLILSGNKLKTITKATLTPLRSLKRLDLQENLLESFGTYQIPELPSLETLNLSNNPLKSLDFSEIEKVAPKLKTVDLTNTPVSEAELGKLPKNGINFIRIN